jgi:hypothetical protein
VAWGWLSKLKIEGHRLRRTVAVISLARFQPAATRAFLEFVMTRRAELQHMAEGHPRGDEPRPGERPPAVARRK